MGTEAHVLGAGWHCNWDWQWRGITTSDTVSARADCLTRIDFWGPVSNFGIPIAAIADMSKDPEMYVWHSHYSNNNNSNNNNTDTSLVSPAA